MSLCVLAGGGFQTAGEYAAHQAAAHQGVGEEAKQLYERLAVGLLQNMVTWHQASNGEVGERGDGGGGGEMRAWVLLPCCVGAHMNVYCQHKLVGALQAAALQQRTTHNTHQNHQQHSSHNTQPLLTPTHTYTYPQVPCDGFTPTFAAALNDFLSTVCSVVGPHRWVAGWAT